MASLVLSDDKTPRILGVVGADAGGQSVPITGKVSWVSGDPSLVTVTPNADGLTCVVAAGGPVTANVVQVTASDVEANGTFTGSIDITVAAGPLASLQVVVEP